MTRRERLERKLEKRQEWAESRREDADRHFKASHAIVDMIPMGQPILVGHHSERRHRNALKRSDNHMRHGCESQDMAEHHESKAAGLERQLETHIFSDDENAVEALQEKLAGLQAEQERDKTINKAVRKAVKMGGEAGILQLIAELAPIFPAKEGELDHCAKLRKLAEGFLTPDFCGRIGIPSYVGQNRNGNMSRIKKRLEYLKQRAERTEAAEQSDSGFVIQGDEWVQVTFAEKPDRAILDALKANGFRWGGGCWGGRRDKLPECLASKCGERVLCPDDSINPCVLPAGHDGYHNGGVK